MSLNTFLFNLTAFDIEMNIPPSKGQKIFKR